MSGEAHRVVGRGTNEHGFWNSARWRICPLLVAVAVCGCDMRDDREGKLIASDETSDEIPPPADPESCVCTPVAPFGFDGPSLVGTGAKLTDIECPEDASLPGFAGLVLSTNEWARECRITPLPTCSESGWVCAPPPPTGFSLCIYRGEEFSCPDDYKRAESVLEADGVTLTNDPPVTLCCREPDTGG